MLLSLFYISSNQQPKFASVSLFFLADNVPEVVESIILRNAQTYKHSKAFALNCSSDPKAKSTGLLLASTSLRKPKRARTMFSVGNVVLSKV